jgi:hypothetical protein
MEYVEVFVKYWYDGDYWDIIPVDEVSEGLEGIYYNVRLPASLIKEYKEAHEKFIEANKKVREEVNEFLGH